MGIRRYTVSEHAWQRWLERSRFRDRREAGRKLKQYMQDAQPCWPRSRARRKCRATFFTGGGYVFVARDNVIVTVYPLRLNEFEV